ncbi:MAG TPA: uroporphyrinogen-III synthase [Candidatus Limnocylindria bacterium]|nr:uroporphyrinogen-III synthase [Candidatus Limnocylindria bacterium]
MPSEPLVLLTRPEGENAGLATRLAAAGIASRELPCIRIEPLVDPAPLRDALLALTADDLLVITSRAGASAVAAALGGRACAAPVAAVGPATGAACGAAGLQVVFTPSVPSGTALALELPLPRGAVLLARSDHAAVEPAAILRGRGALVGEVVAYRTVTLRRDRVPAADAVVFASPSAVEGFAAARTPPGFAVAIAIGPATANRVRVLLGTEPVVATPDEDELARTIQSALAGHRAAIGR